MPKDIANGVHLVAVSEGHCVIRASGGEITQNSELGRKSPRWAGAGWCTLQEVRLPDSKTATRLLTMIKCVRLTSVQMSVEGKGFLKGR